MRSTKKGPFIDLSLQEVAFRSSSVGELAAGVLKLLLRVVEVLVSLLRQLSEALVLLRGLRLVRVPFHLFRLSLRLCSGVIESQLHNLIRNCTVFLDVGQIGRLRGKLLLDRQLAVPGDRAA